MAARARRWRAVASENRVLFLCVALAVMLTWILLNTVHTMPPGLLAAFGAVGIAAMSFALISRRRRSSGASSSPAE